MASLEDFEDEAKVPPTKPNVSDLEKLPNGEYTFQVRSLTQKNTDGGRLIVKLALLVISDGEYHDAKVTKDYWLDKKDKDSGECVKDAKAFEFLRRDLITLGFDVPNWNTSTGRPFNGEFKKACAVIGGVEFKGKKVSDRGEKDGTMFHNLYVNKRSDTDGKPSTFGPEELKPPPAAFSMDD